jgi:hypothetical protein
MIHSSWFRIVIAFMVFSFSASSVLAAKIKHVFVIAMENTDAGEIYNAAPGDDYIADLMSKYAHADNFVDEFSLSIHSEPHYIVMEAGTNEFADHTFLTDNPPVTKTVINATKSHAHLATQLTENGRSWRTYQEVEKGAVAGSCLLHPDGNYVPRHNPFIFFEDVTGSPPQETSAICKEHIRPYAALATDLVKNDMADYVFITPDLCHDMHNNCFPETRKHAGDHWLKSELPPLIAWAKAHDGVIFLTWDEGDKTGKLPFLAIGAHVKPHYSGKVVYDHGSMLKSVEEIFNLNILPTVKARNDLADLFEAGYFP